LSDHHIFTKDTIAEILNLQLKGGKAKPYQVKQVRHVMLNTSSREKKMMPKYEVIIYWSEEDETRCLSIRNPKPVSKPVMRRANKSSVGPISRNEGKT
jgi:hypothetical protein